MRITTLMFLGCSTLACVCAPPSAAAQTELDHIVVRVGSRIITQSDIRRAGRLQLVEDATSDDAVRRGLENRTLILAELARLPQAQQAGDDELPARLAEWETRVGGHARAVTLMAETQTSDANLNAWLRDDVRIQAFVKRQFGTLPEGDRAKATADWITRLRQRAGLR